jgi:hypothetical protein
MRNKIITIMLIAAIAVAAFGFMHAAASGPPALPAPDDSAAKPPATSVSVAPPTNDAVLVPIPDDNPLRIPWLTEEQKAEAVTIVLSDERVRELIQDRPYEIAAVSLMHEGEVQLGATVRVQFDDLYEIVYDWPYAVPIEIRNGEPTYCIQTYHAAKEVTRLQVEVDLRDGVVLAIDPSDIGRWQFEEGGTSNHE